MANLTLALVGPFGLRELSGAEEPVAVLGAGAAQNDLPRRLLSRR